MLGPGTRQQAPNIPAPKELKLESRLLQKEAFGGCCLFLYLREYLGDSSSSLLPGTYSCKWVAQVKSVLVFPGYQVSLIRIRTIYRIAQKVWKSLVLFQSSQEYNQGVSQAGNAVNKTRSFSQPARVWAWVRFPGCFTCRAGARHCSKDPVILWVSHLCLSVTCLILF